MRTRQFKTTEKAEQWLKQKGYTRVSEWFLLWDRLEYIASIWFNQKSRSQFALLVSIQDTDGFAQIYY